MYVILFNTIIALFPHSQPQKKTANRDNIRDFSTNKSKIATPILTLFNFCSVYLM